MTVSLLWLTVSVPGGNDSYSWRKNFWRRAVVPYRRCRRGGASRQRQGKKKERKKRGRKNQRDQPSLSVISKTLHADSEPSQAKGNEWIWMDQDGKCRVPGRGEKAKITGGVSGSLQGAFGGGAAWAFLGPATPALGCFGGPSWGKYGRNRMRPNQSPSFFPSSGSPLWLPLWLSLEGTGPALLRAATGLPRVCHRGTYLFHVAWCFACLTASHSCTGTA